MPEGLSAAEVGKEIAEHNERAEHAAHTEGQDPHSTRHDVISIVEAVILSLVALLAAWSGYSAAKWGTHSSLSLARASSTRTKASLAGIQANQIRTLDSVSFNAVATAFASGNAKLFRVTVHRLRPGYRPAFRAWLATHPLTNPKAPPGPAYMPQYRIPQEAQARALNARADAYFTAGEAVRRNRGQVRAPHRAPGGRAVPDRNWEPLPLPAWARYGLIVVAGASSSSRWWSCSGCPGHRGERPLATAHHRRGRAYGPGGVPARGAARRGRADAQPLTEATRPGRSPGRPPAPGSPGIRPWRPRPPP